MLASNKWQGVHGSNSNTAPRTFSTDEDQPSLSNARRKDGATWSGCPPASSDTCEPKERWVGGRRVGRLNKVVVVVPMAVRSMGRTSDSMASRRLLDSNFFAATSPPELMRRILALSRSMATATVCRDADLVIRSPRRRRILGLGHSL